MSTTKPRRQVSPARVITAWLLVLLGLAFAIVPMIAILERALPYFEGAYYRPSMALLTSDIAAATILRGYPAIVIWSIAWWVRTARPPRPAFFYALAAAATVLCIQRDIPMTRFHIHRAWYVPLVYLGIGVGLAEIRRLHRQLLPRTPSELFIRLTTIFPGFHSQGEQSLSGQPAEYDGTFRLFCDYFRVHGTDGSTLQLADLGALLNDCVNLASAKLRDAALDDFLRPLAGEPVLDRLKLFLNRTTLEKLESEAVSKLEGPSPAR